MIEDPRYDPRLMGKFGVNPEQDRHYRMLLIKELMKVHHDCREKTELDDMPMDELCENYKRLYHEACAEMEKIQDPNYQELLQYMKTHLTEQEFQLLRIEIYAACNKIIMQHSTLDRIAHLVVLHEPPT
ncbi:uncharacterized protein LOC118282142 isoform X2 [Spodoptera frugiperda]|uniref:Uncharacterized protein LOC118282142 isoform X2 n=1 Tax=Spodoptera frugiperda TaxID=7108 RepID=A0A9R0ETG5_SPOFR|nr:uncharacterized protein LOC118282142 isoform X2 [Spodoptera frugiperda]